MKSVYVFVAVIALTAFAVSNAATADAAYGNLRTRIDTLLPDEVATLPDELVLQGIAQIFNINNMYSGESGDIAGYPPANYSITQYLSALGYPVEAHNITTDDGYILTYFRVQAKNTTIKNGLEVVYWQHGLLDSSDLAVMNSEDKAPALMLANRGYDVWLGNSRGNWHSRANTHLNPDEKEFWQFTWQDMAMSDLPAAFEYITNYTGKEKINYIGHSQGTLIMHAALALGIEAVTSRVKHVISTGPIAYSGNITSEVVYWLCLQNWAYPVLNAIKYWDFLEPTKSLLNAETDVCNAVPWLCDLILKLSMDLMPKVDNTKRWAYYTQHFPCGTSLMNIHHWQQIVQSNTFQLYDYGEVGNLKHYGQATPPKLDVGKITQPVHLFAGDTDELANPVDVVRLFNDLTSSQGKSLHMYHMGHLTFLIGKNIMYMNDVYKILES